MSSGPPRPIAWLLRRCLPDDTVGASIAGDLYEEFARDPDVRRRGFRFARAALGLSARYFGARVAAVFLTTLRRQAHGGRRVSHYPRQTAMHTALEDLHDAWRGLRRRPLFTLAGIGLLACGLAASSTVFSFVEAVMLRPLPMIPDADRIVRIEERGTNPRTGAPRFTNLMVSDLEQIAATVPSLEATTGMLGFLDGGDIPFTAGDGAIRIPAVHATAGFFDVVGVRPALGRPFTAEDQQANAPRVVVLSHAAWQRWFSGRPDALGQVMTLAYEPHTIVGVMPRGFRFPAETDVYLPLRHSPFTSRFHVATALARVRPGIPLERVHREVDAAIAAIASDAPGAGHGEGARVLSWRDAATERVRPALRILAAAAALVLVLAAANLGGLLMDRATARGRELAVRRSLGATNTRVVRLLLAEGLLLGIGGALVGALITALTLRTVVALSPADLPFRDAVRLDLRVLAFTAGLAALTGTLAGVVPAIRTRRGPMLVGERAAGMARSARGSNALVAAQIAIAMVLVSSAMLLTRSFVTALRVDPGIRTDGMLLASITLNSQARYPDDARQLAFFHGMLDSLRAIPGVAAAEVGLFRPLSGAIPLEISREPGGEEKQRIQVTAVSPGLLPLLQVPVLEGRGFEARDNDERAERVALVSRTAAAQLFPGESPVGRFIHRPAERHRIVGVVADVRQAGPLDEPPPLVYLPFRQYPFGAGTLVITGHLPPAMLNAAVRGVVRRLDPDLPLDRIETLAAIVDESLSQPRFYSVTVGVFGALALGLAVAGLYAVIAFAARRRMFEFGVRSALGARPSDNLWLVYRQGLALALTGVAAGLVLAFYAGRAIAGLLYRTSPSDPAMLALSAAVTLVIALAAVITPAVRAARVDPVVALRAE